MSENRVDKSAFYKLSCGLYIITSTDGVHRGGCVVNTVTQVTSQPPRLMIAVNKDNFTRGLIEACGYFTATALTQEADMTLIGTFGFRSGRDENKFENYERQVDPNGVAYVNDGAAAVFSCRVEQEIDLGTHVMFIGRVTDSRKLSDAPLMTYEYYHKVKKGATPKNAPSYKGEETAAPAGKPAAGGRTAWRCTICGYILEEEELPADFVCPVCKRPASFFEKITL